MLIRPDSTAVKDATTGPTEDATPSTGPRPMSYAGAAKLPAPPPPPKSTKVELGADSKKRGSAHPASALACKACHFAGQDIQCEGGHCSRCKAMNFPCQYQRCTYDPDCVKKDCSLFHAGQLSKQELKRYNLLPLQFRKPGQACTAEKACEKI